MRITKLMLPFLLCISTFLAAQKVGVGFQAGLNLVNIVDVNLPDNYDLGASPRLSFSFNTVFSFLREKKVGFSVEPGYIVKGSNNKLRPNSDEFRINFHYIQLPILANINITDDFFLSVGPEINYLIGINSSRDRSFNKDHHLDKLELAGQIAVGYHLTDNIAVGGKFSRGLTSISDFNLTDENGNTLSKKVKQYNQYGQLFLRYTI